MTEIVPSHRIAAMPTATSAQSDEDLLRSWLQSLNSPHSRRNFEQAARRFLAGLPAGLRNATVEDVRNSIAAMTAGLAASSSRQYLLRAKSLMTYAHELGYTRFNAGVTIKVQTVGNRGAALAKRIISEADVELLIRFTEFPRDKTMLKVLYAAGLRVSELVALNWDDCLPRDTWVQLHVLGKGGKIRNVLLPENVSQELLALRGGAAGTDPVFQTRGGDRMSVRNVHALVKRAAQRAGVNSRLSPHWLRHAHGSHAIDRGATLAEVQETLGHSNVSTTSGYLHAKPKSSSGLKLVIS